MIRSEVPRLIGPGGTHQHGVERLVVVVVLPDPDQRPQTQPFPRGAFFFDRRLRGVMQRVEGGPVGVGNGSLRVIRVPLVLHQIVALLRHPDVRGCAADREKRPGVRRLACPHGVVVVDRERLPLASDNERQHPVRHIHRIAAEGVPRSSRDHGMAVQQVHHAAHFVVEFVFPAGLIIVVIRRRLGPHAMHQPQLLVGMGVVPMLERPVKRGRQDGVQPDGIGVRGRHQAEPMRIGRIVGREFGREFAGSRCAEVDALHEKRAPAPVLLDFKPLAVRARRRLRLRRAAYGRHRAADVPECRELLPRIGVVRGEGHRSSERGDGRVGPAASRAYQAKTVPTVGIEGIDPQRRGEAPLGVLDLVVPQSHESKADLHFGQTRAERIRHGEACSRDRNAVCPVGLPGAVRHGGGALRASQYLKDEGGGDHGCARVPAGANPVRVMLPHTWRYRIADQNARRRNQTVICRYPKFSSMAYSSRRPKSPQRR